MKLKLLLPLFALSALGIHNNDAKITELVNELRATIVAKGLHAGS